MKAAEGQTTTPGLLERARHGLAPTVAYAPAIVGGSLVARSHNRTEDTRMKAPGLSGFPFSRHCLNGKGDFRAYYYFFE